MAAAHIFFFLPQANGMNDKITFIIGASSGIGLATAQKLVDQDDTVYCGARSECPDSRITSIKLDVTQPMTVTSAVEEIINKTGRIDRLVYSAGYSMAAPVELAEETDYRYLFEVNYFGALTAVRAVLPHMRVNGEGKIVFVGSMGGVLPIAYDAFYSSSKAALMMLGKELNLEVNRYGIRVSTVLPGGTSTRFTFKRKVYSADQAGVYGGELDKSVGTLAGIEQGGMSPDAVADTIIKVLYANNPPAVVASGMKNKAYYFSEKLMPEKLTRHFVSNTYNLD